MSEATQIASMGITTMIELMQARDEIKRLKEQLAKQEQGEPYGVLNVETGIVRKSWEGMAYYGELIEVYTKSQQRKPLTDDRINTLEAVAAEYDRLIRHMDAGGDFFTFQIEAAKKFAAEAHGIKE